MKGKGPGKRRGGRSGCRGARGLANPMGPVGGCAAVQAGGERLPQAGGRAGGQQCSDMGCDLKAEIGQCSLPTGTVCWGALSSSPDPRLQRSQLPSPHASSPPTPGQVPRYISTLC